MPNFLDETAGDLFDLLSDEDEAGRVVSIRHGATVLTAIPATLDVVEYEIDDRMGIMIRKRVFDWTIKKSSLGTVELRSGDVVEYENGSITERFELHPMPPRNAVEPRDAAGTLLVLHTEQVEVDV